MDDGSVRTTVVLVIWDEYVKWLGSAVADLRAQNLDAQIVVVDNASTVELPALPHVRVTRTPARLTRGAARDFGLLHVTTPYVVMWDVDDTMLPGTLSFLEHAIGSDRRLVAFATAVIEHASGRRHRWPRRWIAVLVRAPGLLAFVQCVWSVFPTTGATIMRADLVRSAGGYGDHSSGEDWYLGVSLAFRGRIGWSERPGRVYRVHERSNWARHATDLRYQLNHALAVRERIRTDPGVARWAKSALPLIALSQYLAVAAHLALAGARSAKGRRRGRPTRAIQHVGGGGEN
jgi:glycosyltransferase involved in cell wall biosynthesis